MEAADDSQKSMGARSTGHRAHLQKSKFVPDCEFKKRVQTCLQTNATRIRGRPPIHPTLASDKLGNVCRPKPTPVPARKKCRRPLIVHIPANRSEVLHELVSLHCLSSRRYISLHNANVLQQPKLQARKRCKPPDRTDPTCNDHTIGTIVPRLKSGHLS